MADKSKLVERVEGDRIIVEIDDPANLVRVAPLVPRKQTINPKG